MGHQVGSGGAGQRGGQDLDDEDGGALPDERPVRPGVEQVRGEHGGHRGHRGDREPEPERVGQEDPLPGRVAGDLA